MDILWRKVWFYSLRLKIKAQVKRLHVSATHRQLCGGGAAVPPPVVMRDLAPLVPVTTTWQLQFMRKLVHDGNCSRAVLDNLCAILFPLRTSDHFGYLNSFLIRESCLIYFYLNDKLMSFYIVYYIGVM